MGICYIVGAGEFYGTVEPCENDLVIAADGGYSELKKRGIRCDLLVGDMDSIECSAEGIEKLTYPVEKDETDTYLAYIEGVKRDYNDFIICGGVGGREDHTFANYSLLVYAKKQGHNVKLIGKQFDIFALKDEIITITDARGAALSVFAFGGDAEGVSIKGCKYCADNISLSAAFPLGVSNTVTEDPATVGAIRGELLVMLETK